MLAGDPELQLALRLAMFHLISLIDATGEAAVGARGIDRPRLRRACVLGR